MEAASAVLYLRESEDIVLHAEGILRSDCDSQKSGQGPKVPHVDVHRVKEPDLRVRWMTMSAWRRPNTAATWSLPLADLRHDTLANLATRSFILCTLLAAFDLVVAILILFDTYMCLLYAYTRAQALKLNHILVRAHIYCHVL
jgi:hypothetical protein